VRAQQRIWCRIGTLLLIAFLENACTSGTALPPIPYTAEPTEVDLQQRDMNARARYLPPRHVSQYRYDKTEVDLATPLPR
jgi:hypothetical protein